MNQFHCHLLLLLF